MKLVATGSITERGSTVLPMPISIPQLKTLDTQIRHMRYLAGFHQFLADFISSILHARVCL